MKKVYLVTLGILLVAALILGSSAKPALAWKWPKLITIVTHSAESPFYAVTVGWGAVFEKATGSRVRVMPEEIGPLRFKYVKQGRHDMAVEVAGGGVTVVLEGIESAATREGGPFQVRALWTNCLMANGLMVRGDSDIKTTDDLKPGIRFAIGPGPIQTKVALAWAAWAGLKKEDVQIVPFGSLPAAVRAIADGKADIVATNPTAPWTYEVEAAPHGIRWLDTDPKKDPQAVARYIKVMPFDVFAKAPRGSVKSAEGITLVFVPAFYFVRQSTDPELTYHLAKWLDENFDAYKKKHPDAAAMSIDTFRFTLDTALFPVHEGVIKYLKEKGMWTAADDKRQAYNVDLVSRYVKAYEAAIAAAGAKGIKVDPKKKEWMNLWAEHKKDLPVFKIMLEIP